MDGQGGHVTRLTFTETSHGLSAVDPSRRFIVTTRERGSRKRLWILDTLSGEQTAVTADDNDAEGDSFSPDGEWIVFWMIVAGDDQSDIYKIRRDGTELTNLTRTRALEFDPAWSQDGTRIAFVSNEDVMDRFVLKTMDADGGDVRLIHDPVDAVQTLVFPAGVYDPSWSPDDRWILVEKPVRFTGSGENGNVGVWHILKISADGTEVIDLSETGGHPDWAEYVASFSPDGRQIVFSARVGGVDPSTTVVSIFTMDVTGQNVRELTTQQFAEFASWIP